MKASHNVSIALSPSFLVVLKLINAKNENKSQKLLMTIL